MRRNQVRQLLPYDLTHVAELAQVRHYLEALDASWQRLDRTRRARCASTESRWRPSCRTPARITGSQTPVNSRLRKTCGMLHLLEHVSALVDWFVAYVRPAHFLGPKVLPQKALHLAQDA